MIAIDSNLLIYAQREAVREHAAAQRALERASCDPRGWGIPLPCITELWRAVTSPALSPPSAPERVIRFLEILVADAGALIWSPRDGFWQRLTRTARDLGVSGQRIFDLQIALIALENGASEIWTHDQGFANLPGLSAHDPL